MIYTLDGELHLSDVPTPLLHQLIRELTVPNPRYENALRLGRPAWNIPRTIMLYEIKGNALTLPRGMAEEVWRQRPAGTVSKDRTLRGEPCAFEKAGFTLRDYQKQAVDAALACKWCQGVLVAPCGAGKTEIGMALIARLGRPALWITHTLDLAQQAKERAQLRLGLDDREVAVISGKSKRLGTKLTIATVQSLYRMELDELSRTVGVVIVDECQFLTPEQIEQLRQLVDEENLPVLCFGLRTDFLTHLFPGSRRLFELADSITEIKTICDCGRKATTNARISPDGYVVTEGDQVFLGGNDSYIAMCHKCYQDYINEHRKVELLHGTERDSQ